MLLARAGIGADEQVIGLSEYRCFEISIGFLMHAGFKHRPAAAVTRPLMVYRDVEGVEAFMGATIASRGHSVEEIALKNF
jgi:hypothetical protein